MPAPLAYRFDPYRLLPQQRQLLGPQGPLRLGGRAFDLLLALVEHHDRTLSKDELIGLVWPRLVVEENNLAVQINQLRKLLGHTAVATVPGRGYRFGWPVQVEGGDPVDPSAAPADAAAADTRSNLPAHAPALLGRDDDLRALHQLLAQHALVTVTGPGGIGKTRLALAGAQAQRPLQPDGVWWIDLSALADAALVPDSVALALGLSLERSADVAARVRGALQARQLLLVLDNAEHLLPALADTVAGWLAAAPRLRVLVTSQQPLHLAGEQLLRPEPLALPADDDPRHIEQSSAVALFVARARAADRRFVLGPDNREAVADICRRLDGLPLAIELAAARVPLLGVHGLRARLDQRLMVLTGGPRDALQRHRTLRAALEWSHQLLSADEQLVLARLAVLAGGFSLEAAQAVAEVDDRIDPWDVLEHLGTLVDKSLVVVDDGAEPLRYRLLESTRLFMLERLIESEHTGAARSRHRAHFADLATQCRDWMLVGDPRGLATLDRERDNLLLALAWTQDDPDGEQAMHLLAGLRYYWHARGLVRRGLEAMRAALARTPQAPPGAARCLVLLAVAQYEDWIGQPDEGQAHAAQGLAMAEALGDDTLRCNALGAAGFVAQRRGDLARAQDLAGQAMALADRTGDSHERGNALSLQAAVQAARGEHAAALATLEQALDLRRRLGHAWAEAMAGLHLGQLAINAGDPDRAVPHLLRAFELAPRCDSQMLHVNLLGLSGEWCAATGRHADSVLLDAACVQLCARLGLDDPLDEGQVARLAAARQALGEAECARQQQEGRSLTVDEALARARQRVQAATRPG